MCNGIAIYPGWHIQLLHKKRQVELLAIIVMHTKMHAGNDDVIKWKHLPRYWPFVWRIHRSPVNSSYKGQWHGALMFSLICARANGWVNSQDAGQMKHHVHYDVTAMRIIFQSLMEFPLSASIIGIVWQILWAYGVTTTFAHSCFILITPLNEIKRLFYLFIYFIKTSKIGEIHVQYMNNINITW